MKLRKAARSALLDLEDPLDKDSDSDYETEDYEYLSDVAEEDEDGEHENDDACGTWEDGQALERDNDDNARAYNRTEVPFAVDVPATQERVAAGVHFNSNAEFDGSDAWGEDEERKEVQNDEDEEEGTDEAAAEKDDAAGSVRTAFNPFSLLDSDAGNADDGAVDADCRYSQESACTSQQHDAAVAVAAAAPDSDCKDIDGGAVAAGGRGISDPAGSGASECRRRRQRKNPRRRRRGAPASEPMVAVLAALPGQVPCNMRAARCNSLGGVNSNSREAARPADGGDEHQGGVADCWLCFGEGRVTRYGASGSGTDGCGGHGDGAAATGGSGGASEGAESELVAPCRTCAGYLRYIHRSCFERWLGSSWALACPNCRKLYDSSVVDAFTRDGPSVPAMLLAACPPDHDLRQPLPPHSLLHFCVGGMVELSMPCGGFTPAELLRHIRGFMDQMEAHGGDGGVGLADPFGSPLQLPSFEVTGLALILGSDSDSRPAREPWADLQGGWLPLEPDEDEDEEDHEAERRQRSGGPQSGFRPGAASAPNSRMTVYDIYRHIYYSQSGFRPGAASAPNSRMAVYDIYRHMYDSDAEYDIGDGYGAFLERDLEGAREQPHRLSRGPEVSVGTPPVLQSLRDEDRRHSAMRSAADRAAMRAEQQRRRADLLLQQRNQQRHAGSSRGLQAMSGVARGGVGRRR